MWAYKLPYVSVVIFYQNVSLQTAICISSYILWDIFHVIRASAVSSVQHTETSRWHHDIEMLSTWWCHEGKPSVTGGPPSHTTRASNVPFAWTSCWINVWVANYPWKPWRSWNITGGESFVMTTCTKSCYQNVLSSLVHDFNGLSSVWCQAITWTKAH